MTKTKLHYLELDSFRFFAFLLVFVHHSASSRDIPGWVVLHDYGWMGVDLFLCLSAFLFARLLFVEYREKGDIHVGYFYLRRGLRIWPLYFIFVGAMIGWTVYSTGADIVLWDRLLGLLTFTDNLFSMFLGYNLVAYSAHLWTISYEEQFYAVIPWVLRIFYRSRRVTIMWMLGAFMLFGMMLRMVLITFQVEHPAIWVFPLTHFESILGGLVIGLGLFDRYFAQINNWFILVAGLILLSLVGLLQNVDVIQWQLMFTYPFVGIGWSLVVFAVLQGKLGKLTIWMRTMWLGYLGKISYGLYVYHIFSIALAQNIVITFISPAHPLVFPVTLFFAGLGLTILISTLSYQILEKPFLRVKERFAFIQSRPV